MMNMRVGVGVVAATVGVVILIVLIVWRKRVHESTVKIK